MTMFQAGIVIYYQNKFQSILNLITSKLQFHYLNNLFLGMVVKVF